MAATTPHRPVLLEAVLTALAVRSDGAYLDATFGRGGHARALLERLGEQGRLTVVDRDPAAIATAQANVGEDPRVQVVQEDFSMLEDIANTAAPERGFDGVLLDLGVSSPQLDEPERGFSLRHEGPLDMRMDPNQGISAADWLASVREKELADVLYHLGDERHSRRIARAIVRAREQAPIATTTRLAGLIASIMPSRDGDQHPATRSFQAIRIHINDELGALDRALGALPDVLAPGGRAAVISFHSLEDRRVKRFIRDASGQAPTVVRDRRGRALPTAPVTPQVRAVGGAITPDAAEVAANPRARSARLRVLERLP